MSNDMSHSLPSFPDTTYVPPLAPSAYLRSVVVSSLLKRGFEGAEAGALAEIERLLEQHITNLFEDTASYAHLAGRRESNALDLVVAQEESGWGVRRMRREAKRRRAQLQLPVEPSPPPSPTQTTLADLIAERAGAGEGTGEDRKPDLGSMGRRDTDTHGRLSYAQDWAPPLPPSWTLDRRHSEPDLPAEHTAPPVTSALLDFIKLTATERGDIPPELGVVDYRRGAASASASGASGEGQGQGESRGGAQEGKKRKWGVKGFGVRA